MYEIDFTPEPLSQSEIRDIFSVVPKTVKPSKKGSYGKKCNLYSNEKYYRPNEVCTQNSPAGSGGHVPKRSGCE
jgi:hypothetical protein